MTPKQLEAIAAVIAHARSDIPDLIAEVERLRRALHGIESHADDQDLSHLEYRLRARECARQALGGSNADEG